MPKTAVDREEIEMVDYLKIIENEIIDYIRCLINMLTI